MPMSNFVLSATSQRLIAGAFFVEGGKAMEVNVRVEDPGAFTMPWSALQRYRRVEQGPMREAVCAENNANFFNYDVEPIPQAVKPDF